MSRRVTETLCLLAMSSLLLFAEGALGQIIIDGDVDSDWKLSDPPFCNGVGAGAQDAGGCDDEMQALSDTTAICLDASPAGTPITIFLLFQFDQLTTPGSNAMDGCWLFDANENNFVDTALCFSVDPPNLDSFQLLSCNDTKSDRCPGSATIVGSGVSCALDTDTPEPPGLCAAGHGNDTAVECSVPISSLPTPGSLVFLGPCTFPAGPGSDPKDCIFADDPSGNPMGCTLNLTTGAFICGVAVPVELQSFSISP